MVGKVIAYDDWGNANEVINMKQLDEAGKKAHVKKLWQQDPKKY